jgi:hypothetical protein
MEDKADVIRSVCEMLSSGDTSTAAEISRRQYPFLPRSVPGRNFSETQALPVFLRDGFVDRYSGKRLLFPPVLRVLTSMMPDEFPFHRNWKMSETHPSYWELFPTLDHIVPIARGGPDHEDNIVSTSMLRNSAKANWTLEELGWSIHPPGDLKHWDGMMTWCIEIAERTPQIARHGYIGRWCRAALSFARTRNRANTLLD